MSSQLLHHFVKIWNICLNITSNSIPYRITDYRSYRIIRKRNIILQTAQHVSRSRHENITANIDVSKFSKSFLWKVISLKRIHCRTELCTAGYCSYVLPKDNRSFRIAVNSHACIVENIARGNNQFVVTLENFISTRRQKAAMHKRSRC